MEGYSASLQFEFKMLAKRSSNSSNELKGSTEDAESAKLWLYKLSSPTFLFKND